MAKILLAGEIMAEKQYVMDKIPSVKEVGMVNGVNYLTSSKIINAGRILAVGNEVNMFGCIGEDADGDNAIKDFEKYGIDSSLVYRTSEAPTGQVLVLTNSEGQSGFIVYLSAVKYFDNSKLESLSGYDFVYMATSMEQKTLKSQDFTDKKLVLKDLVSKITIKKGGMVETCINIPLSQYLEHEPESRNCWITKCGEVDFV